MAGSLNRTLKFVGPFPSCEGTFASALAPVTKKIRKIRKKYRDLNLNLSVNPNKNLDLNENLNLNENPNLNKNMILSMNLNMILKLKLIVIIVTPSQLW